MNENKLFNLEKRTLTLEHLNGENNNTFVDLFHNFQQYFKISNYSTYSSLMSHIKNVYKIEIKIIETKRTYEQIQVSSGESTMKLMKHQLYDP